LDRFETAIIGCMRFSGGDETSVERKRGSGQGFWRRWMTESMAIHSPGLGRECMCRQQNVQSSPGTAALLGVAPGAGGKDAVVSAQMQGRSGLNFQRTDRSSRSLHARRTDVCGRSATIGSTKGRGMSLPLTLPTSVGSARALISLSYISR